MGVNMASVQNRHKRICVEGGVGVKLPELTKAQEKQKEITRWAVTNGWRPDPVGRAQIFGVNEEGQRIRIRFFERSITLEINVPLTEEEKKEQPLQKMHWVVLKKRAYSKVHVKREKLDWTEPKR